MYELVQVGERSYYLDCPAKIGIYREDESNVYIIDSGNDKEAAKKILKCLKERQWELKAVINTHSNSDHIGGNHLLQERTGCKIYAKGIELAFAENPILEPAFLYGGFPPAALQNKFLMASSSKVLPITDPSFPKMLEVIPLEGHFFHMIGLRTPDQTVFLADSLFGQAILNKYHITFIYDVRKYLRTLDEIEQLKAKIFIPSHASVTTDIGPLVQVNRQKVLEVLETLLRICQEPKEFSDILREIFIKYELQMDFNQYVLVGSTIRSYLAYLSNEGNIEACFEDNRLRWCWQKDL